MSKFQIIFTGIFIVFIVAGVILFATYKSKDTANALPAITIWGTFPESTFNQYISRVNLNRQNPLQVSYKYISEENFDDDFIGSLARGQGPDAILIAQDMLYRHEDKVIPIPYDVLTQRDFKNTFIEQAELYLHPTTGTLAIPFIVDPLVIYWNRDTFTNAGIAQFPRYWSEFTTIGQKINQKDANSNIRKSLVAMGEFANVTNAREIMSALILQAGNPMTYRDENGILQSGLGSGKYDGLTTTVPAVEFYTKFADPRNTDYSWNRALPNSKNSFLIGNLATYIGFASEIFDLRQKNPNIDFDVSELPQASGAQNRVTYGKMYGLSIVRSTVNTNGTFQVLTELVQADAMNELVALTYLPPVRRDMISSGSTDPYLDIFFTSALISKGWLDSDRKESNRILQSMVESITSGRQSTLDAIEYANDELDVSLGNI